MTESLSKYLRIPKTIKFPFGYTVRVVMVTLHDLKKMCEDDVYGLWDCGTRTIYLAKNVPMAKRRYALGHELSHALLDWQHLHMELGVAKP